MHKRILVCFFMPHSVVVKKWVCRKCTGIKGSIYKVMKTFVCRGCVNPVTGTGRTSVDIGVNANLELEIIQYSALVVRSGYTGNVVVLRVACTKW